MSKSRKTAGRVRLRERKNIEKGVAHIKSTFNNTSVTISDTNGNVFLGKSGGMGFKALEEHSFAARGCRTCCKSSMEQGMREVECYVKGSWFVGKCIPP